MDLDKYKKFEQVVILIIFNTSRGDIDKIVLIMQDQLTIYNNRLAAHEGFFVFYNVPKQLIDELTKEYDQTGINGWEYFTKVVKRKSCRFIYLDSIAEKIRDQYGIPDPKKIPVPVLKNINSEETRKLKLEEIYQVLDVSIGNRVNNPQENLALISHYLKKDYNIIQCKKLVTMHIVIEESIKLYRTYSGELIYIALMQLSSQEKHNLQENFPELSCRTFYRILDNPPSDIESAITNALRGKPSNFGSTCAHTKKLVAALSKHFNGLPDRIIMQKINAIILALPNLYNNGKIISRANVNNIRNGRLKHLIKAGKLGDDYIVDVLLPGANLAPTFFPLDKVEIDFTGIHASMRTDGNKSVKKVVCKFKDACSGKILARVTGKTECYELFNKTFRKFLRTTGNLLAAEFVMDNSPAYEHEEFQRIYKLLTDTIKVHVRFTGNPRAKGGIESHFSTLVSTYMPEYVGTLGGNITNSHKHRPNKKVRLVLNDPKYMEDELEWEKILHDMDNAYHSTPYSKKVLSPMQIYDTMEKPHAIKVTEDIAAYLSYYRTYRKFSQAMFVIDYEKHTYKFGRPINEYVENKEMAEFLTTRTGDSFDLYLDPDRGPFHAFLFESGTIKLVDKLPLIKMEYGNSVDQMVDPSRAKSLHEFLDMRLKLKKNIKNEIKSIFADIKEYTGCDAHTLFKEVTGKKPNTNNEDDLMYELLLMLRGGKAMEIDPLTSTVLLKKKMPYKEMSNAKVKPFKASDFIKRSAI